MVLYIFLGDERPIVKSTGDVSAPLRRVNEIRFGLLSPEAIVSCILYKIIHIGTYVIVLQYYSYDLNK